MKTRIFISRSLNKNSPLKRIENSHAATIVGESLIQIQPITIKKLPKADWFFFYSKNGVTCFTKQWSEKWKSSDNHKHIRWAAIGEGTAEALAGWGITCDFVGQGTSKDIANQFLTSCKPSESVVFFRAFHSKNTIYQLICEKRDASHIAIYDNQLAEKEFHPIDIGIFTSSRNAIAFFEKNQEPSIGCIAIGQPTAETLHTLNVPPAKIQIADEPSETALFHKLVDVMKKVEKQ